MEDITGVIMTEENDFDIEIYADAYNRKQVLTRFDNIYVDGDGIAYVDTRHMGVRPLKRPYQLHFVLKHLDNGQEFLHLLKYVMD